VTDLKKLKGKIIVINPVFFGLFYQIISLQGYSDNIIS